MEKRINERQAQIDGFKEELVRRDIGIFYNTLSHAVTTLKGAGIPITGILRKRKKYTDYVIRLPK